MNKRFLASLGIALIAWAMLIGYKAMQARRAASTKTVVAATFYPLAEFAQKVGGGWADVITIVPPGTEPHDFEPNIQQVAEIYKAGLFIYNGAGLDNWAGKIASDLPKNRTIRAVEGEADPHTWLDPILAASEAGKISQALEETDPAHKADYQKNLRRYQTELEWLDKQFRLTLDNCRRREIITSHQAFFYLAKRYNLKVYSISGISPEEEPSPGKMAEISQLVQNTGIKYIFFETLSSPKIAQTIAQETGAQTLVFNPLEGLTAKQIAAGEDYISVQQMNLNNLKIALECH